MRRQTHDRALKTSVSWGGLCLAVYPVGPRVVCLCGLSSDLSSGAWLGRAVLMRLGMRHTMRSAAASRPAAHAARRPLK